MRKAFMKRWFPGWRLSTPSEEVVQDISVLVRFYPMVVSVDRVSARREHRTDLVSVHGLV